MLSPVACHARHAGRIPFKSEEADMSDLWLGNLCNGLSALQGGPVFNLHELTEADMAAPGRHDDDGQSGDEPQPDIKPPLPNEVPAPQPSQPDVEPYQTPPPADPGLPQPTA
jgi:hypothetical protein